MKRILYILIFACCSIGILQAERSLINDPDMIYPVNYFENPPYRITGGYRNIYIQQLEPDTYVMVFDGSGRNLYKQTVGPGSISVPVRSKGVFIVRIQKGKEIYTQKVLVK